MKTINICTTLLGIAVLSAAFVGHAGHRTALASVPEMAMIPEKAWVIPFDAVPDGSPTPATQDDYYRFGWQSFLALNWPAESGERGAPDTGRMIGAKGPDGMLLPTVWETYKDPDELFLPGAAAPRPWNSPPSSQAGSHIPAGALVLSMASMATPGVLADLNQAGFPIPKLDAARGPLIDQNRQYVRYQVRLNRSEFECIDRFKYYNADLQKKAVDSGFFQTKGNGLPKGHEPYVQALPPYAQQGVIELKASWRILDPARDILGRYFHQQAWLIDPDGKRHGPYTVGLVGLHILRLTPTTGSTWFWATFEQVDNVHVGSDAPRRPNGAPLTPTFNPGTAQPKQFPSGYSYEPPAILPGEPLPPNPNPVDVWQIIHIPAEVEAYNDRYRAMLGGTVWQYYKMINVQNPYASGSPAKPNTYWVPMTGNRGTGTTRVYVNSNDMSNTTMETYLQANNCIACHGYGRPKSVPARSTKDLDATQIFTFLLNDAKSPASASVRTRNSAGPHRAKVAAGSMRLSPG